MKEILYILIIAICLYILELCVLEIIKIIKKYKSEKAKIQEEIDKLNHLLDIDKCLLEIMPEDDNWSPDDNFIQIRLVKKNLRLQRIFNS